MKFRQDIKIISKRVLIIIVSSLILNFIAIDVNAQISWQRDLIFGKFTSYGPGHITISGDANSIVTTDGQVVALSGITPQSANLHVKFNGLFNNYVTITYDAGETFRNGSSSLNFTPSPANGKKYSDPGGWFQNGTLDIYLGGTLTIGTGMIGGTYTDATIMVYCSFSYQ